MNKSSPLKSFLDMLQTHDDFLKIALGDITTTESSTLIRELSDRPLQEEEIRHIQTLAGGNPFFLIELTLEYLAGRLDQPSVPPSVISIPLSIRQVLQRRLSNLSSHADRLLGALSVHLRPISFQDLAGLVEIPIHDCVSALDQLHEFRLVSGSGNEVSNSHELIRQTVYQGLSDSMKAWLHERVAKHLVDLLEPPPPDELAIHFHAAGLGEEARGYSKAAADHAEESGAVPEALRFLQIAREHSTDPDEVAELIARMGHLHYLHQNLEEAAPLLEIAAQRFRRQAHAAKALVSELERVDALGQSGLLPLRECLEELERIKIEAKELGEWGTYMRTLDIEARQRDRSGDLEGIRALLNAGERHASLGNQEAQSRAQALLALNTYFGDPQIGLRAARLAIASAEEAGGNDLFLHALNRLLVALHYQGMLNTPEGLGLLQEAEKRLARSGDLALKFNIRLNVAVWHMETRDFDRAQVAFEAAAELLRGTKAIRAQAMLQLNLGELYVSAFDIPKARACYCSAEPLLSKSSPDYFRRFLTAGFGLCALYEGDLQEARAREADLPEPPPFWTIDPTIFTVFSARMKARRGDFRGATTLLGKIREEIRSRFRTAWLRLALEECSIERRRNKNRSVQLAKEALTVSRALNIPFMEKGFLSLIDGDGS
jgi:tetratricopeptide (TPR) repeat protein